MKKILVIDDDDLQRELYLDLFKEHSYHVFGAKDGLEGLEIALKEVPDLIFTGIIMPRMDGFELVKNLKANVVTTETPVIMFSHLGRQEDREKIKDIQKIEFMIKGMDSPKDILKKVAEMIEER